MNGLGRYLLTLGAFVAGVCLLQQQATLPPLLPLLLAAALAAGMAWRAPRLRLPCLALAALLIGMVWAGWHAQVRLADRLSVATEGRTVVANGHIDTLPHATRHGMRFGFRPDSGSGLPSRVQVSWYGEPPPLGVGERWRLTLRPKRPHGVVNPGGHDLERWMLQNNLGATATVRHGERLPGHAWRAGIDRIRAQLGERIRHTLGDAPHAGVIVALAVGEQSAITPDLWQRFARTGITHLVSISGLHVTLLATLVGGAVGALWRRVPWLASRWATPRARLAAGLFTALCYSLLAGFGVPTRRTLLMLLVGGICLWRAAPMATSAVWITALAAVVLFDPFAVLAPGFWLSFLTVGALLWLAGNRDGRPHWARAWAGTQWAATLATFPLLVLWFQQVPLASPLANAVAIPLVSLVVTPLTLLGLLDPSGLLLWLAERVFAGTDWLLGWLAALPYATWNLPTPPAWMLAPAAIGVLLALLPTGVPGRWLAPLFLLPLFLIRPEPLPPGHFRATVLDVGQGLSVLVQTRHHALLYDTATEGMAERAILPSLRALNVRRLDTLLVSHDDNDHAGGVQAILDGLPVERWSGSLPPTHPARAASVPYAPCIAGQRWQWDAVHFEVVWPPAGHSARDDNGASCVLRVANGQTSLLLPGDIGRHQEAALRDTALAPATVVVAPHHGSRSSSGGTFVAATAPEWVAYSAGYLNRFRHPNRIVVDRYAAHGAQALRTDADGALVFDFAETVLAHGWRQRVPRYWSSALVTPQ
ncbi:DNA internalization-related competence protein ComEC/Rec2 [Chitiniphilus eburneus]|uniref:DNA internalization-related competence protein ComEC/Rec2 n=1 Tax=Chitiniphilus eburneus TaxID=2571148 RepID=UPI00145EC2EB|nr:DNA internalization-related competence protein ComEC/Rec2 [Chitiniphilus eburneus]